MLDVLVLALLNALFNFIFTIFLCHILNTKCFNIQDVAYVLCFTNSANTLVL